MRVYVRKRCSKCNGSGEVDCKACGGSGYSWSGGQCDGDGYIEEEEDE